MDYMLLRRYFSLTQKHRRATIAYSTTLVILGVVQVFIPLVSAEILDSLTSSAIDKFTTALIVVAILWLIDQIFYFLACASYSIFLRNCFIDMNQQIITRIYSFKADELLNLPRGKIIDLAISDAFDVAEMMEYITDLPFNSAMSIGMTIILYFVDWRFGLLVTFTTIFYFLLANFLTKRANKHYAAQRRSTDKLVDLLQQTIDGIREIKTYHLEESLNKKFQSYYQKFGAKYMLRRKYHIHYQVNLRYIMYIVRVIIYLWAASLMISGELTIGAVVMIISYATTIFEDSYATMQSLNELRRCKVAFERIWNFLRHKQPAFQNTTDFVLTAGRIRLKNVSFNYANLPTLHHISFTAEPNRITAIIGKTGAGKTTIFNLLLRLYSANSGEITLDHIPIEDLSDTNFYKYVATINQKDFFFDMSIRENLALVNPDQDAQIAACQRVGIHDVIKSLPKGYSTILTKEGANLSGGQKRLLAFAKALLSNAKILLLDEVTSSLDPNTTKQIIKILKDLAKDHTILLITHKKELMQLADKLILLKRGRIIAQGNYAKVIKMFK